MNVNLALRNILFIFASDFFRKILRHGASGFTYPPKEGVLWIFIDLKNPSPRQSLNPQTIDPVTSTLTITPPRRHV
jgi:hypothetical protein